MNCPTTKVACAYSSCTAKFCARRTPPKVTWKPCRTPSPPVVRVKAPKGRRK